MSRTCTYCDGHHSTEHCTERLEAYNGVPSDHSVRHDDGPIWVQDLDDEAWHASMVRDDDVHMCACGAQLECPVGGVKPDGWRVDELDRCESCLSYIEEEETIPDGGEFERASELRADGGTCVDGTEREELDAWEVHLAYSKVNESPSDECLTVAAPDRETAIEEARRVSRGNPPEVGPVYNDRDRIPVGLCDNADRYENTATDQGDDRP